MLGHAMTPDPNLDEDNLDNEESELPPMTVPTAIQVLDLEVKALMITDAQLRETAMKRLIYASTLRKKLERDMAIAVKPTLEKEAQIRKPFHLDIGTLKAIEAFTMSKIQAWDREELRKARERQAAQNLRIEEQNKDAAAKADAKGLPLPMMKAPAVVQVSESTVKTEEGSAKRKLVKAWTIHGVDLGDPQDKKELAKLPASDPRLKDVERSNLVLNVKLLDSLVELGQEPAGIIIFDDVEIKTRRGRWTT